MPITADVAKMQEQHEQLLIMAFLSGLRPEHDAIRSQILASRETSLTEAYSRANRAIRPQLSSPSDGCDHSALASSTVSRGRGRGKGGTALPLTPSCSRSYFELCRSLHGRPPSTTVCSSTLAYFAPIAILESVVAATWRTRFLGPPI
ncbi:hypothetical protein Dimus_037975 [Dionaea muscipula]